MYPSRNGLRIIRVEGKSPIGARIDVQNLESYRPEKITGSDSCPAEGDGLPFSSSRGDPRLAQPGLAIGTGTGGPGRQFG